MSGKKSHSRNQEPCTRPDGWRNFFTQSRYVCLRNKLALYPKGQLRLNSKCPKFVNFVTLIYIPWWLKSTSPTDVQCNDLDLYIRLLEYEKIDRSISSSALKAFQRHLWYLTSEMVPLSLFSDMVPTTDKENIAKKLLEIKPDDTTILPQERFGTGYGKPKFAAMTGHTRISLSDFVAGDSWFFFHLLEIDPKFMDYPVETWTHNETYKAGKDNVRSINCVNDCAERGVKLSSDFLGSARMEKNYQNVLQVVEKDRKTTPNLRSRKKLNL